MNTCRTPAVIFESEDTSIEKVFRCFHCILIRVSLNPKVRRETEGTEGCFLGGSQN